MFYGCVKDIVSFYNGVQACLMKCDITLRLEEGPYNTQKTD